MRAFRPLRIVLRAHGCVVAAILLTACGRGCSPPTTESPPPKPDAQAASHNDAPPQAAEAALHLEGYGVRVAARQATLGTHLIDPGIAPRQFAPAELNRRFWVLVGPHTVVMNDRPIVQGGHWNPEDLGRLIDAGMPEWRARSGVEAKAGLLLFDEALEPTVAIEALRQLRSGRKWPVTALFRDVSQTDQLFEVVLMPSDTTPM